MRKLMETWKKYIEEVSIHHNCATLVKEGATGEIGKVVSHSLTENGSVEFYDVQFKERFAENIFVSDLEVLEAHDHSHPVGKRDDKPKKHKKKKKVNPWAICTAQVGRKNKKKYEKCVKAIKRKSLKEQDLLKEDEEFQGNWLFRLLMTGRQIVIDTVKYWLTTQPEGIETLKQAYAMRTKEIEKQAGSAWTRKTQK